MKDIGTYINENQEFYQVSVNLDKLKNIDKEEDNQKINIICKAFINILYNYKYHNKKNSYINDFSVKCYMSQGEYPQYFDGDKIGGYDYHLGWSKRWDTFIDELEDLYDIDEYYMEICRCGGVRSKKLLDLIEDCLADVIEYRNYGNYGCLQIKFSDLIKKNVYESIYALYKELVDKDFKL